MSTRSEWQLAFRGNKPDVLKLEAYMKKEMISKKRSRVDQNIFSIILKSKNMVAENKITQQRAVTFAHSYTKCDEDWNAVIDEVLKLARKDLKIQASYARLGDGMEDYEFNTDDDLPIYYERHLVEVDI